MIHYQCFLSLLSLPLPCFISAHNILTMSFFDGGVSHDSRKVAPQRGKESVKAKCEEAETETEELIKLIHLVGCEGRERQAEKISHSLIFPNILCETYQITGCILKPLGDEIWDLRLRCWSLFKPHY